MDELIEEVSEKLQTLIDRYGYSVVEEAFDCIEVPDELAGDFDDGDDHEDE